MHAPMAELVDALVSNTNEAIRAGSSPARGTKIQKASLLTDCQSEAFCVLGGLGGIFIENRTYTQASLPYFTTLLTVSPRLMTYTPGASMLGTCLPDTLYIIYDLSLIHI